MKLIKFRIQHYKSIKDTGWSWLASDVTTLAGKNESGKSAILEALADFDTDVETIQDTAMPLNDSGNPLIAMSFEVENYILDDISEEIGITISKEMRAHISKNGVTIVKLHPGAYRLIGQMDTLFTKQTDMANEQRRKKIEENVDILSKIEQLASVSVPEFQGDVAAIQTLVDQYISQVNTQIESIPEGEERQSVNVILGELTHERDSLDNEDTADKFLVALNQYTPHFIFFSDFLDILPFELPLAEAKNNETVRNFAKVSGLDLDKVIETTDLQRRRNILSEHSARISGDFMDYWEQDQLDLVAEADGDILRLGVKESGSTILFKPEQRSKGFQWFLSFYLRLNAEQGETNVILIDEPGLYLHAKAQKDVLKVLEEISEESQVIYSTHSPYLIDAQRLDRVRLILKDDREGTRIENKIHKNADVETLTPIITAVGLDISHDFSIAGKKNVLLEGISDYYFVQALREYIGTSDANHVPCVGAQKIPQLVSLLIGWDLEYVSVFDNDAEGRRVAKELKEKLSVESSRIIFVSDQSGLSIEDLFTHDDFNKFVLEDTKNDDIEKANSTFLKNEKLDKVLLAKKFFDKVKDNRSKVKISKKTIIAFSTVFDKIDAGFEES